MAKKDPKTQTEVNDIKNTKDIGIVDPAAMKKATAMISKSPFKNDDLSKDRLINRKDVEYLGKILDVLWPKSKFKPKKLKLTTDDLVNAGMRISYKDALDPASIAGLMQAYVYRISRAHYSIFINGHTEAEAFDSMDLHEKGHILFLHTDNVDIYQKMFSKELDKIWDEKVAKWFTADAQKGYRREKIVQFIFAQFANIAQDMEINSKLFEKEWIEAKRTMSRSSLIMRIRDLEEKFDPITSTLKDQKERTIGSREHALLVAKFKFILDQLTKRADGKIDDILFCYPSYYDWPEKLDWFTYLMLLVKNNFDEVMEQVQQMAQEMAQAAGKGGGQGNSQGTGNGSGQDDGSGSGAGQGQKPISKDVLDNYFDDQAEQEKARSGGDTEGEGSESGGGGEKGDGDDEGEGSGGASGRSEGGTGRGQGGGAWVGEVETHRTFDSFVKFLNKVCLGKELRKMTTDLLYYSNRNKNMGMGGVVLPRRFTTEKWMPTAVTIVIDISGSVNTEYVERIINAIVSANSGIDLKKSHIVFCDTDVRGDEILSRRTRKAWSGGGTSIANGIKYVFMKGYVKKGTDKLIVVSDLEDNLDDWIKAADGKPGQKYVVGYNVNNDESFDAKKQMKKWIPNNDKGWKFVRTFKTMMIEEKID